MPFTATKLFYKAGEGSGGGGGSSHDLGYYATESALTTAHPTASDGDHAIVGSTDTVWIWDSDTTAWKDNGEAGIELPSQTGNSGKFLTTNGTSASWSDKPLVNKATGTNSLTILGSSSSAILSVNIGFSSSAGGAYGTSIGFNSVASGASSIGVGKNAQCTADDSIGVGGSASAIHAIQLGHTDNLYTTNSDANTFKVGNANGNYEMMSADGTIPTDRYTTTPNADGTYYPTLSIASGVATRSWAAPVEELPAQTGNSGKFLTTNGTAASWATVDALPTQTGHSGEFLTTDGTDASWAAPTVATFRVWGANE